jgi:hypothetical protein
MDNINKILTNVNLKKPEVIDLIKKFIMDKYKEEVNVALRNQSIIVEVNNSALANAIRFDLPYIKENITDKKIILRTSRY